MILTSPTPRVPSHGCWRQGGAGGGAPGGRVEGVVETLLIVELGSPVFLENTMVVLSDAITQQKIMVVYPPTKYIYRLKRGWGTRW